MEGEKNVRTHVHTLMRENSACINEKCLHEGGKYVYFMYYSLASSFHQHADYAL